MNAIFLIGGPLLLILLFFVRVLWSRRKWYALSWRMPGQVGWPFFGCASAFANALDVIENMERHSNKYGNLSKVWIGPRLFVFVSNPTHIEQILNSPVCLNKGLSYRFIENVLGPGLITMESNQWRQHRKLLSSSFHYNITTQFVPIFNKHLRILVKCLGQRSADGQEFDILHFLKNCSMDMICETTMDRETCTQSGENSEYLQAIDSALAIIGIRMFNPWCQPNWMFKLSKYYARQERNTKILLNAVTKIIEQKLVKHNITNCNGIATVTSSSLLSNHHITSDPSNNETFAKEKHIFIDRVLKLSHEEHTLTFKDVQSETNTILLAGFETTATSMAFIMLMLAMHPEYQQHVYDELAPLLSEDGVDITQADLAKLKYLDMFIKETLRVFPVVPFLTRTTDAEIQIGDYTIPTGVELILGVRAMHHSKDNYPLGTPASTFDPDNFLPEQIAARHPYAYIPFSGGPRSCIGTRYANIVLKMSVVYVLKDYRLSTSLRMDDFRFRMNVTLNLLTTHLVRLHPRQQAATATTASGDGDGGTV